MNPDESIKQHEGCLQHVAEILNGTDTVKYVVDALGKLGRNFTTNNVKCIHSEATNAAKAEAGYMWHSTPYAERGDVVLHEDKMSTAIDVERSLRHELIHAFDDLRGYVDPSNCYHQACSEIRAARLSGDCFFQQEVKRGHFDFLTSGRSCVQRRAALAVEHNPLCRGFGDRAVQVVFPKCYGDYEPFVAPLYAMGNYRQTDP